MLYIKYGSANLRTFRKRPSAGGKILNDPSSQIPMLFIKTRKALLQSCGDGLIYYINKCKLM